MSLCIPTPSTSTASDDALKAELLARLKALDPAMAAAALQAAKKPAPPKKTKKRKAASDRPKKPYPSFPLTPHVTGAWFKKIGGKCRYFGRWGRKINGVMVREVDDGWENALTLYNAQAADLHAGRVPQTAGDERLAIKDLCNRFLTAKQRRMQAGRMTARSFAEYKLTTDRLIRVLGKEVAYVDELRPCHFEMLLADIRRTWGLLRESNEINRIKGVFKHANDNGYISKPVPYGSEFVRPDKAEIRKHSKPAERMIEAHDLRRLIDIAGTPARAMILLGLNAGFGATDCATLPETAVDLAGGWVEYKRPKTGVHRRAKLWNETVQAIQEAMAARPEAADKASEGLIFRTVRGRPFTSAGTAMPCTELIGKLLRKAGIHRAGLGIYSLRRVFRTVADSSLDAVACNKIMGHSNNTMAETYTLRVDDSRLEKVAEHVHAWLFPPAPAEEKPALLRIVG